MYTRDPLISVPCGVIIGRLAPLMRRGKRPLFFADLELVEGSRCELHPKRWRSGSTREWRKTRARILARDGYRCTTHIRPGERCPETRLLEIHHIDGSGDVLLVPDSELAIVCRRHNPRDG